MKVKKKRIISLFLAALMLFSVLPMGAMTASALTGDQRTDIIDVAKTQIGNTNGSKYTFGAGNVSWCAYFIVWCARQANIDSSVIKTTGFADADDLGVKYYSRGSYTPKKGDIIIFDYQPYNTKTPASAYGDHVGLVEYVEGNYVHTIEGNSSPRPNAVRRHSYALSNSNIKGYGVPNYKSGPHVCSFSGSSFEAAHPHKVYQKCSCGKTKYTGATRAYQKCSTCMKLNRGYVQPVKAYTINTGKTTVYNAVSGTAKSNKIYDTDLCTISQIYDCGWCKVTFPLDAGGTDTGYCKIGVFMKGSGFTIYTSQQINTYRRSDLKTSSGYAGKGDKIYILGNTSKAVQIAYPLTAGGWKVGWIPISSIKSTIKYNANGGSGSMTGDTVNYMSTITLKNNTFTKTGNTFNGWYAYRTSDKRWSAKGGWYTEKELEAKGLSKYKYPNETSGTFEKSWIKGSKSTDEITFHAVWKPNTLSVNYHANGGTISSDTYKLSNNIVYKTSDNKKLTQTWTYNTAKKNGLYNASSFGLTRDGYTFKGWGTNASGGTVFDQNDAALVPSKINANIKNGSCATTLYAIWEKKENPVTHTHKWNTDYTIDKEPTCTETGLKSIHCADCDAVKDSQVIPANGHKLGEYKVAENATCTETGLEKSVCSNCNYSETRVINALGHDYSDEFTVDKKATCTENGEKSKHCSKCDSKIDVTVIPLAGHSYGEWTVVTSNTCTEKGTQIRVCTVCDNIEISETPATGHSYETVVIKPTPFEKGYTLYTCTQCGYSYKDNYVDPTLIIGDVNGDGEISVIDATDIQKYLVGLCNFTDEQLNFADVDGDGEISVLDATQIQKYLVGLAEI